MKNKHSSIAKLLATTTAITGVFAATNPATTDAATNASVLVAKAEKLAKALKNEVSYEYRKKTYAKNVVDYPNMKLFNETKAAYMQAKASVAKVKGKEKEVLEARLAQNVKTYYDRAVAYIDAVTVGKQMEVKAKELQKKLNAGVIDNSTEKLYHELSRVISKNSKMIWRVYGKTTRTAMLEKYQKYAYQVKNQALYPVTIKIEIDRLNAAVAAKNVDQALYHAERLEQFFTVGLKEGALTTNSKVYQSLIAKGLAAKASIDQVAAVLIATSTDANNPTVEGGTATQVKTYNKPVVVVAGKGQYIKLANVEINGDLIITGRYDGAGTVYLENVKVSKINNAGGAIIVNDVADHSLHTKNVQAEELRVNDADGANIVAETGTKIKAAVVTEKAGASGAIQLEAKEQGAFESVGVAAKGTAKSQGVQLKGDFSQSKVSVTGENAQVIVDANAVVKELEIKAGAKVEAKQGASVQAITLAAEKSGQTIELKGALKDAVVTIKTANASIKVAEGTQIKEMKKDPSVQGDVKVENKGTIETIDPGISTSGGSTGGGSTGGGGSALLTFSAPTIVAKANGSNYTATASNGIINLGNATNDVKLYYLDLGTLPQGTKLVLTSLTSRGQNLLSGNVEITLSSLSGNSVVYTYDLLGALDSGRDGISLANLRMFFGTDDIVMSGYLKKDGYQNYPLTLTVKLGTAANVPTSFETSYFQITKNGIVNSKHQATVTVKDRNATLGQLVSLASGTNISIADVIAAFQTNGVTDTQDGQTAQNAQALKTAISALFSGTAYTNVKLGDLVGRTVEYGSYRVVFTN